MQFQMGLGGCKLSRKRFSKATLLFLSILFLLFASTAHSQTATVTSYDDQLNSSGDLGAAINTLGIGGGTILFQLSTNNPIVLGSVVGGLGSLNLTGPTTFNLSSPFPSVLIEGVFGPTVGPGAPVSAGGGVTLTENFSLRLDNGFINLGLLGGSGSSVNVINSNYNGSVTAADGGDALLNVGTGLTLDTSSSLTVTGGDGGGVSVYANGESGIYGTLPEVTVTGGNGGDAGVTAGSLTLLDSNLTVTGGNGGGVAADGFNGNASIYNDSGSVGVTAGNGGNSSVTAGPVSLTGSSMTVMGGNGDGVTVDAAGGGYGIVSVPVNGSVAVTAGNGGAANVTVGPLSMDTGSSLVVAGGAGGAVTVDGDGSYGTDSPYGSASIMAGNGGAAGLTAGSVTLLNSTMTVSGGDGGVVTVNSPDSGTGIYGYSGVNIAAGNGGDADVTFGSLTMDSSSNLTVTGGMGGDVTVSVDGNYGLYGSHGPVNVLTGNGGDAAVSVTDGLTLGTGSGLTVMGGNGGVFTMDATDNSDGISGNGSASVTAGNGGAAEVMSGSITLLGSNLTLAGGNGGGVNVSSETTADTYGIYSTDSLGVTTGNGGNAGLNAGSVTLSGSNLNVTGGNGGAVTVDATGGSNGIEGTDSVTIVAGNGGDMGVTVESLSLANGSNLTVAGGNGGGVTVAGDNSYGIDSEYGSTSITAGDGGAAVVTSGSVTMSNSTMMVSGGDGGGVTVNAPDSGTGIYGYSGVTIAAGNGGDMGVTLGSLVLGNSSSFAVSGGIGGGLAVSADGDYGLYGSHGPVNVLTGNGGDAAVSVTYGLTLDTGSGLTVTGGNGGVFTMDATDNSDGISGNGSASVTTGNGGDASVTAGSVTLSDSTLTVAGGDGGGVSVSSGTTVDTYGIYSTGSLGITAGDGWAAEVRSGSVMLSSSSMTASGGNGGGVTVNAPDSSTGIYGYSGVNIAAGNGGDADVTFGSLTMDSSSNLTVTGGMGGDVTVSVDGNYGLYGSHGPVNVLTGNGGDAAVSVTDGLTLGTGSGLTVMGGNGGVFTMDATDNSDGISGNGSASVTAGNGGDAALTAGALTLSNSTITVSGGDGGGISVVSGTTADTYGIYSNGSVEVTAGNGGKAGVTAGAVTLSDSNLTVTGGNGGGVSIYADGSSSGIYSPSSVNVAAGNGGNASVSLGSLGLDQTSTFSVTGGLGGQVTGVGGTNGTNGSASVTLGSLTGSGTVTMWGSTATLQIGSGNFSGVIAGNEFLVATGAGALTLSGNNTYSGGTYLEAGTLNLGNNNALGTLTLAMYNDTTLQSGLANLSVSNNVNLAGNDTVDTNGNNTILSGFVFGVGTLTKIGAGALTLTGDNDYSGGTTLDGGTVNITNNSSLGTGALAFNGGTLQAGVAGLNLSLPSVFLGTNGGTFDVNSYNTVLNDSVIGTGGFTLADSSGLGGSLNLLGASGPTVDPGVSVSPGGAVTLSSSFLTLDSGVTLGLFGGAGSSVNIIDSNYVGSVATANGGAAGVSVAAGLTLDTGSSLEVTGGDGGGVTVSVYGDRGISNFSGLVAAIAGNGGDANVAAGSVTLTNSTMGVIGGDGGGVSVVESYGTGIDGVSTIVNTGNGGDAILTVGPITVSDSNLTLTGGNGGGVTASALTGGSGSGINGQNSAAVTTGNGGIAGVTTGAVTLSDSDLEVTGGNGGGVSGFGAYPIVSSIGTLNVVAGNGGNASVSLGSLGLDSTSTFSVTGGLGGQVTGVSGTNGTNGTASVTLGSLTGSGTVTMNGSTATLQIASGNFSGVIEGNESLDVAGGGALTLTGANTYTGGTTVSGNNSTLNIQNNGNIASNGLVLDGGTLQAGGTGLNLSENVTLTSNNGTFDTNGVGSTLSGVISDQTPQDGGGLVITSGIGGGSVTLSGENIYLGGTSLDGGTANITNDSSLGSGALTFNGGTLQAGTAGLNLSLSSISVDTNGGTFDVNGDNTILNDSVTGTGGFTMTDSSGDGGSLNLLGAVATGANGTGGSGILSLTSNLTVNSGVTLGLSGGEYETEGHIVIGSSTAGDALVTVCSIGLSGDSAFNVAGGEVDNNGPALTGGNATAGNASVTAGSVSIDGTSTFSVSGGEVETSNTFFGGIYAYAGNASVTVTSIELSGNSAFNVAGGEVDTSGGDNAGYSFGGNASVTAGSVSMDGTSAFSVTGGMVDNFGGNFNRNTYAGNASVTVGSLNLVNSTFGVTGGEVDNQEGTISGYATAGNASVTAGSLNLMGSTLVVTGGGVDDSGGNIVGTATAGDASVTVGSVSMDGTSTLSVLGGQVVIGSSAGNTDGNAFAEIGSLNGSGTVTMNGSTATLQVGSGNFSGVIEGNESLDVAGGALTLSGDNTYSGGTTLSTGTLNLGNNNALGTGNLSLSGGTTLQAGRLIDLTISNNVSLTGNDTVDAAGNTRTITFSGVISGTGSLAVTSSSGTGELVLANANTYSGGTTLSSGGLMLGNNNALGTGNLTLVGGGAPVAYTGLHSGVNDLVVANTITLIGNNIIDANGDLTTLSGVIGGTGSMVVKSSGTTLTLSGDSIYSGGTSLTSGTLAAGNNKALGTGSLAMSGGTTLQAGVANLALANNISLTGNDRVDTNGNNAALSGVISGTGSLAVTSSSGSGALTLSGNNSYSGGTSLTGGTLNLGSNSALGTGSLAMSGGTTLQAGLNGLSLGNDISLAGSDTYDTNGITSTLSGILSGTGNLAVISSIPSGAVTLTGDNTYSGGTAIDGGTVVAADDNALGTGVISVQGGTLLLDAGVVLSSNGVNLSAGTTLAANTDTNNTVGSVSGAGAVSIATGTLTTGGNNDGTDLSGVVLGSGGLTKTGSGALTLTGINTYSGGTDLQGGTLNLGSNTALGTGALTMEDGTTLQAGLNGLVVANNVTLNGFETYDLNQNGSTLSGVLSGTGSLSVTVSERAAIVSNALTLTGNNSYSGGTFLWSGTLHLGNDNAMGTGSLTIQGGTLQAGLNGLTVANNVVLNGDGNYDMNGNGSTLSGVISGTGTLFLTNSTGSGALTLTGDNTYSGGTFLNGGTLNITSDSNLGNSAAGIDFNGGTLQFGGSISTNRSISIGSDTRGLPIGIIDLAGTSDTLSGVISGAGNLTVADGVGGGVLTLTGNNTYSGGTSLTGGTLNLGNNSALGTGVLTMEDGTTLQAGLNGLAVANNVTLNGSETYDSNGNGSTLSGVISGAGNLNVTDSVGGGVVTLTGANTYTGGTNINGGTLSVSDDTNLGDLSGGVTFNGGTLEYTQSLTSTRNFTLNAGGGTIDVDPNQEASLGSFTGAGALTKTGTGTLSIDGDNDYSGGTNLNGGTLNLGSNTALGTGSLAMADGTILQAGTSDLSTGNAISLNGTGTFDSNGNGWDLSGVLSGSGSLVVTDSWGGGSVTLTGNNSYSGGTDLQAETLNLGNNNALGTGAVTIEDGTTLQAGVANLVVGNDVSLNGSDTVDTNGNHTALSGVISGAGNLNVADSVGGGALTLSGDNTYSGGTDLQAGTLNLGNNNALGTGNLTMEDGTTLQVGVASLAVTNNISLVGADSFDTNGFNATFSGVLSDPPGASLTKVGVGILTLSGDNTYSGGTNINAGGLMAANANALGTGNVAVNGGTLLLAGPLTVAIGGNYTQASNGTLLLGLGPTAIQNDRLSIAGTATLSGTLMLAPYSGFLLHDNESFTLLTATSVSGTFGTVTDTVGGDAVTVVYNATDVVVDALANAPSFAALGTTGNQRAIGGALDNLASTGGKPNLITYLSRQTDAALPAMYDLMSPANLTPLYQISFTSAQAQAGMVGARLSQLFGDPVLDSRNVSWNGEGPMFASNLGPEDDKRIAQAAQPDRWGVFVNGLGDFGTVTGDANAPGYQYSTGGTTAGLDHRFSKNFVGGLLLGYSQSGTSQSTGSVNVTGGQLGLYGGWKQGGLHLEALAEGGINNYTTQRVALGGTAVGSTQGQQYSGQLNIGYEFKAGQLRVGPFASGQYTSVNVNGFTETDSLAPLSVAAQGEGQLSSDVGLAASRRWDLGGGFILSPRISAAWEHLYQGNLDSLNASFGTGGNFTVNGPAMGTDAAVLGAGLNAEFAKGFGLFAQYQGMVGQANYAEQNFNGGVAIGF